MISQLILIFFLLHISTFSIVKPCSLTLTPLSMHSQSHILVFFWYCFIVLIIMWVYSLEPMGTLTAPAAAFGIKPAPYMANFSSQGPNTVTPGILKVYSISFYLVVDTPFVLFR